MVRGEVEWKCVEVGEVEMVRWRRSLEKLLEECRSLEKLGGKERKLRVEVKGNKENRKKKRNEKRRYSLGIKNRKY